MATFHFQLSGVQWNKMIMHVLFSEYTEKTNDWSGTCRKENDIGTSNTSKCHKHHERSLYYYHCRREKLCITIISKLSHNSLYPNCAICCILCFWKTQNTMSTDGKKPEQATTIKKTLPEPVVIAISPGYA